MVINVALPYQDLTIMEACLKAGVNYLDTPTMSRKMKLILNTAGSGLITIVSKKQV